MASFDISTLDVLKISFAIHTFLLLRAVLGKLLDGVLPLLSSYAYKIRILHRLHESAPSLLPRMLSEQLSLLALTVLALVALSHTSVSLIPFAHQPHPTPDFLIRAVLCACAARYIVIASWLLLGREVTLKKTISEIKVTVCSTSGESGSRIWDFLYNVICGGTSLISLGYRQNFLLAMTLPFLELSSILTGYHKLRNSMSALKDHRSDFSDAVGMSVSNAGRGLNFVSFITCFFCRLVLPILFLTLALQREAPLVMDRLPLVWFVLNCAFLSVFHLVLIYREVVKMTGRGKYSKFYRSGKRTFLGKMLVVSHNNETGKTEEGACQAQTSSSHSFCTQNHPESLTNDIHQNIALEKQNINKYHSDKLADLNYGLLRPCDNRNVSFCMGELENRETKEGDDSLQSCHANNTFAADKINIARKKDMSKTWLIYRLLANSLASPAPPSTHPISSSLQPDTIDSELGSHNISEIQPWMFPALIDAISNTKLQYQTQAVQAQHPREDSDSFNKADTDSFQISSDESLVLENSEKVGGLCDSWQSCGIKDANENSQPTFSRQQNNDSLFLSSSNKKGFDKPDRVLSPEPLTFSKDNVSVSPDITYATAGTKSASQLRLKGKHKLSPDCVQLLGDSRESLQGSYIELGKGFSDV